MVEATKKIWMNGELVNWDDANVHVLTHALHYGIGVFEGIRCYKLDDGRSAIFRLRPHAHRMLEGMKILNVECSYTEDQIMDACLETVRVNGVDECYLRPIIFTGAGGMGLSAVNSTTTAVAVWKWGTYLGEGALENGIRAKVSSFARHHVNVGMVQGKILGQYVPSVLAKREVVAGGYDEAIMLDTQGYVAECSGENIFIVKDGVLITPPTTSPILPGITRKTIIMLAREMGLEVVEEKSTRDFLYIADEVFLVGTAAEVTPVREVDDRPIGKGKPGKVTQRIQAAYFDAVHGRNNEHEDWLSIV
jgi:branched-chain amino acid aminotransferase